MQGESNSNVSQSHTTSTSKNNYSPMRTKSISWIDVVEMRPSFFTSHTSSCYLYKWVSSKQQRHSQYQQHIEATWPLSCTKCRTMSMCTYKFDQIPFKTLLRIHIKAINWKKTLIEFKSGSVSVLSKIWRGEHLSFCEN
jgi:hypothetical protein